MNDADILIEMATRLGFNYTVSKKGDTYTLTITRPDDQVGGHISVEYNQQGVASRLGWC